MNRKKALLLVDDEAILLFSMRQELRLRFGPEVIYETALSGEEGLSAIDSMVERGVALRIVISDWLMPGMKGNDFLREVRRKCGNAKLVMLSGHAEEREMEALKDEIGLFAFLSKPYNTADLYDLIGAALAE